jgi:L-lactate dehydrogenase (cytochrome)
MAGAEEYLARESQRRNIPYILATPANASIERIAQIAPDVFWFQLYRFAANDHTITFDLLRRADAAGAQVLVPTITVPVKRRLRDIRSGVKVPTVGRVSHSGGDRCSGPGSHKTGMLVRKRG